MTISHNLRIAIDLDNTIVAYDSLFAAAARERGLVHCDWSGGKQAVRDIVRRRPDGEREWQVLQAHVYGERIRDAAPLSGVRAFMDCARSRNMFIAIVSHKTANAAAQPDGPNLHVAARTWLSANGFFGANLIDPANVYFEESRDEKVSRIAALNVDIVIDDLLEVLTHHAFPPRPRRWLLTFDDPAPHIANVEAFLNWRAMQSALEQ